MKLPKVYAPATRAENVLAFAWEKGDLVIWDNRCTAHMVTPSTPLRDVWLD